MKSIIVFGFIAALVGLNAEASPMLSIMRKKAMQSVPKAKSSGSCTEFSGKWKGSCTTADGTFSHAFAIEQEGCTQVAFDGGYPFQIGGTQSFSEVNKIYTFNYNYTVDWAAGYTTLDMRTTGFIKVLADDQPPREYKGISTLAIDGGKLVLRGSSAGEKFECSYARQ